MNSAAFRFEEVVFILLSQSKFSMLLLFYQEHTILFLVIGFKVQWTEWYIEWTMRLQVKSENHQTNNLSYMKHKYRVVAQSLGMRDSKLVFGEDVSVNGVSLLSFPQVLGVIGAFAWWRSDNKK